MLKDMLEPSVSIKEKQGNGYNIFIHIYPTIIYELINLKFHKAREYQHFIF